MSDHNLDAVYSRIRALLNMTVENGCTPNEAANAARAVEAILTKYNLEMRDVKTKGDDAPRAGVKEATHSYQHHARGRSFHWVLTMANAVGKLYYSEYFWYTSHKIKWIGKPHNTAIAEQVLQWLTTQGMTRVKYEWKTYRHTKYAHLSYLPFEGAFLKGFGRGVYESVMDRVRSRASDTQTAGLVVDEGAAIDAYLRETYPTMFVPKKTRARGRKPRETRTDAAAYSSGYEQGRSAQMSPQKEVK